MKKIGILSICIVAVLLLGFIDLQRQGKLEAGRRAAQQEKNTGTEDAGAVDGGMEIAAGETETAADETGIAQTEERTDIRVLICSDGYESKYHDSVTVFSESGFDMEYGEDTVSYPAGSTITVTAESEELAAGDALYLTAKDGTFTLPGLERGVEDPVYEGKLEIRSTEEGLTLVNELPLESYLCYVVPSEMPSGYPAEALKAQAVCARTYAKKQMQEGRAGEFYADVDDSVSYQVYNNQGRTPQGDAAVRATAGVVLKRDGELLDALYYSTSCGRSLSMDMSNETVFAAFLSDDNRRAYEAQEPWYRWSAQISLADLDGATGITVEKRASSGRAEAIEVVYPSESVKVEGEYRIREFLDRANPEIYLQDGEVISGMGLLPSAFFVMTPLYDGEGVISGYRLLGGGYGHGDGMSQNGAKGMAQEGMDYMEILKNYYGDFDGCGA